MANFIEIVFKDPNSLAIVKRIYNVANLNNIGSDSQGRATVSFTSGGNMPYGGAPLSTYEAYGDVTNRLALATANPGIASVSSDDYNKATANKQTDATAVQQAPSSTTSSASSTTPQATEGS